MGDCGVIRVLYKKTLASEDWSSRFEAEQPDLDKTGLELTAMLVWSQRNLE